MFDVQRSRQSPVREAPALKYIVTYGPLCGPLLVHVEHPLDQRDHLVVLRHVGGV